MRLIPRTLPWAEEQVGLSARIQQSSKLRCPLLKISLPVVLNFVARRCVSPLPVVFHAVARGFFKRCPWFFMPTAVAVFARLDSTFKEREGDVGWRSEHAPCAPHSLKDSL